MVNNGWFLDFFRNQNVKIKRTFRYQPKNTLCHGECKEPWHQNLLLLIEYSFEDIRMLRSCAINHVLENTNEFQSQLFKSDILDYNNQFVVVIDWKPNRKILDLMINKFGNVSIFTGSKYFDNIIKTCSSMKGKCYHLETLLPVIDVLNNLLLMETLPYIQNIFDPRLLPVATSTLLPMYQFKWKEQVEFIVEKLCQRNKKYNLLYEINVNRILEYSPNYKAWVFLPTKLSLIVALKDGEYL